MIDLSLKDLLTTRDRVWITLAALAVLLVAAYYVFAVRPDKARTEGEQYGAANCAVAASSQAVTATVAAATAGVKKAQAAIDKSQAIGAGHERTRLVIDQLFDNLTLEASHDEPHPVDQCVLPADRLRRWAAANAGPAGTADPRDQGLAHGQPDQAASDAASTPVGGDAGSGSEPPTGGGGLPQDGGTTVQPSSTPGD